MSRHVLAARVSGMVAGFLMLVLALTGMPVQAQTLGERVDFVVRRADGSSVPIWGYLWKPAASSSLPAPAVVLIHGSGGISPYREGHYGAALSREGFVVLAVDSFTPRGVSSTVDDQSRVSVTEMTRDAYAARRWLAAQPFVDASKIFGAGFSKGGTVMLGASEAAYFKAEKERFAAVVAFYPGCNTFYKKPQLTNPIYMLLGEKDNYTGVAPCKDLASHMQQAGGVVEYKVYEGAPHSFDGNPEMTRMLVLPQAEVYMHCRYMIGEDGSVEVNGKPVDTTQPDALGQAARASCMKKGAAVWTNHAAKKEATADFIRYLKRKL
jgi:dienelactone hydrolase